MLASGRGIVQTAAWEKREMLLGSSVHQDAVEARIVGVFIVAELSDHLEPDSIPAVYALGKLLLAKHRDFVDETVVEVDCAINSVAWRYLAGMVCV
jgi:hypothetical protein